MHRSKASYIVEFLIHTVFWLGVYAALKALTAFSFQTLISNNGSVMNTDGRMLFPYPWVVLGFLMLLFYSNSLWLFRKAFNYPGIFCRGIMISGWFIIVYGLNYLAIRMFCGSRTASFQQPNAMMPPAPPIHLSKFSAANWRDMQPIMALIFILMLGIAAAYFHISESIKKELLRSRSEAQQATTELQFLRSQVNPHFLFNTLNNLFSMAQKDGKDDVADKIVKLSGTMRYMLYDSNAESVPLEKEIAYLEDCIALHQMRYAGSQLEISFNYPDEAVIASVKLAPMLLIPFLENAFKHGVLMGLDNSIAMVISLAQNRLSFSCQNTDHSLVKKLNEEAGGIGLENVKRRLELLYPGRHKLLTGAADGQYRVNLEIDLS